MEQMINKILLEWSLRVHDGMPNKDNPLHIVQLRETLSHMKLSNKVTDLIIQNLTEGEKFYARNNDTDNISDFDSEEARDKAVKAGTHSKVDDEEAEKELSKKGKDTEEPEKKDKPEPVTYQNTDTYMKSSDTETSEKPDTSVAIDKVNDKRYGVLKKKETALEKGYIGPEDAQKLDEFNQDLNEFLKNPTQEGAEALVEKYKLSQNTNGKKLYLGFIAGDSRKLLGEDNLLIKEVGDVLNQFVDLKAKGDVQRLAMNKLQSTSKPELATIAKSDDPEVQNYSVHHHMID